MQGFRVYVGTSRDGVVDQYRGHAVVRVNERPDKVIDRAVYSKLACCRELKARLRAEPGVYVVKTDVMAGKGTRADVLDLYNLINDGAAGVVLETDDDYVIGLCTEIYQQWLDDQKLI